MTFFTLLPQIHAKDKTPQKSRTKPKTGSPPIIYDHLSMLLDKINGMTWVQIAAKHNAASPSIARSVAINSKAAKNLTCSQVAKLYEKHHGHDILISNNPTPPANRPEP